MPRDRWASARFRAPLAGAVALILSGGACVAGSGPGAAAPVTGMPEAPPPAIEDSKQWQRSQWAWDLRAYPGSSIPPRVRERALETIRRRAALAPRAEKAARWTALGPTPLASQVVDTFVSKTTLSGRVATIAVDPRKAKHWLIGGAQGGIWETKNAGKKWTARSDAADTLAMGAIAFAPSRNKTVYAGTGEGHFSGDAYGGTGVLKSTNGGKTWKAVSKTDLTGLAFTGMAVDPRNPNVVVGSAVRGVRRQVSTLPAAGVFRSTDGGVNWTRTLAAQMSDLAVDLRDFDIQYAGAGEVFGSASNGLYRSLNGGATWQRVSGPWDGRDPGRMELALAPSDPDVLYVSVHRPDDGDLLGLWKSENAQARARAGRAPSWEEIPLEPYKIGTSSRSDFCDPQCWYDHVLTVDPKNPSLLYAGGVWLWLYDGKDWTQILPGHVDQHALAWSGNTLISGNDGGVFSSKNRGNSWKSHNGGLTLTQFYHGAMHPSSFGFVLAGAQDNGTGVRDSAAARMAAGDQWRRVFGGDGADVEIASDNPDTHWAFAAQNQFLLRTTNGGSNIELVNTGINTDEAPFIAPFARCPSNDDVFLAATDRIWRTDGFFSPGKPAWTDQGPNVGHDVTAIAFSPADASCDTYAIGTKQGEIWITTDGGKKWRDGDSKNQVPGRAVTDLAFDPDAKQVLWAVLSGFDENTAGSPGHVFRSDDAAKNKPTWSEMSSPVNLPHNAVVVQPGGDGRAWVGTDLGVWEQTATGRFAEWTHHGPGDGLPNVAVFDLQATEAGIVAFTHGRGAFLLEQAAKRARR